MEENVGVVEESMSEKTNEPTAPSTSVKGPEERKNFICGVIEGFYGRPWTTEQRKDLFRKMKKWGMDSYVYAPKDDYKHRAYWRELYTVEEADHLTSLISAAKEHGVTFYYALSPGLDMTYSSQKEIQTLKRKLDQVSQFGCEAFALLFDDIESELSKVDKEVFQTFANAQVSVTNEVYTHLGTPRFLFCPTQYCSSRAVPTVHDSEYLNTLGSKLNHDIDIMWTGDKVISKIITIESIQEITEVLRRPPVIWDNLHANDYDQKRVFLGPYSGRSPELIPHLRGVMTNPNCEFHANTIAIHTLANWSQCSLDTKVNSSLSADIKLETENEDGTNAEELPTDYFMTKNIYHPRIALKNAIAEWLPEFNIKKEAWGPITKPQPQVTMVMPIIPIIPSINTCMSLTTTTTTSTTTKTATLPEVNTTQLQALAEVCNTVNSSALTPIANPVMNSLVSPTKVVTNDDIVNPIPTTVASNIELPKKIPISIVSVPIMHPKTVDGAFDDDLSAADQQPILDVKAAVLAEKEAITELNKPMSMGTNLKSDEGKTHQAQGADVAAGNGGTGVVHMDEHTLSPLSAEGNEPMECSSSLASQTSPKEERKLVVLDDVVMAESAEAEAGETGSANELNNSMQVESSEPSPLSNEDMKEVDDRNVCEPHGSACITIEDLYLLCDLFYLPFEHGSRGMKLLNEFNWLKTNANVLLSNEPSGKKCSVSGQESPKPEVAEWLQRAEVFSTSCHAVHELLKKVANCANKEICHDLFSYVWDIAGALSLLNAFVKWLSLGHFPSNVYTFTQGSYTWFSKGWKEAFMSGDQEPWVFRGGLIADLQRLMPVDSGNDLFLYKLPELPTSDYHILRPYTPIDETELVRICTRTYLQSRPHLHSSPENKSSNNQQSENADQQHCPESLLPDQLREVIADSTIGHFVTLCPQLCIVAHDASNIIVGYAAAAVDVHHFSRNIEICWIPAMQEKYARSLLPEHANGKQDDNEAGAFTALPKLNDVLKAMIHDFHNYEYQCPAEVSNAYPAVMTVAVLNDALTRDHGLMKRLLTVELATLRANGCFGVHVRLTEKDSEYLQQHYTKIGFAEVYRDQSQKHVYLGRRF